MITPKSRFLLFAGFSLTLFVGGAVLTAREIDPYLWGSAPRAEVFAHLQTADANLPPSVDGTQVVMESCLTAIASVHGLTQPEPARGAVLKRCANLAHRAVAAMPTYSFGWYARAYFSFSRGEARQAAAWLIRSREAAPNAQWIAEIRVALAEDHYALLEDAARASHRKDLALLAVSGSGVAAIAGRYVTDPDFRERITAVVETLEPEVQIRFLQRVREASI